MSHSGYGVHARQIARWVFDLSENTDEVDLEVRTQLFDWGITPWVVNHHAEGGLIRKLWQGRLTKDPQTEGPFDATIQVQLPNEWDPSLGSWNVGVTAAVETTRCNPEWVVACNRMDLVIVPSEFTKKVIEASGTLTTPIVVIPEAFYDELLPGRFEECQPLDLPEVTTKTNLLVFGQITGNNPENDRKNLPYTLKWLGECLADRPDIGVIVKTNMGRLTKADAVLTNKLLAQVITETARGEGPQFHLLHGDMTHAEMVGLYRSPKVSGIVSATRGEAFGLPLLEGACAGVPVLATGWSGHTEFLPPKRWVSFEHDLRNIPDSRIDGQIFMKGTQWAEVREGDFKRKILRFVDNLRIPQEWGSEVRETILKTHSFQSISGRYTESLSKALVQGV